ncbi:hypothetical protein [Defluviimonas sp. SAOS-178_SWC]|uniref:hypothetical protein n=1 Tax=Defluviimonas sp. SAOS-178_SWC TaxID=3121287 RepID=UPI0032217AB8
MNLNRLLNIVINTVVRRLVNFGINKGVGYASRKGGAKTADHGQARDARALAKRARKAARITRRLGR